MRVVALVALSLGAAELLLRALPEAVRGYRVERGALRPPREHLEQRRVNSLGVHDREPAPKAPGSRRVLVLGGERVAAREVPLADGWPRLLAAELEERAPGRYDVVALAEDGWGPREELQALRRFGPRLEPDLVLCVLDLAADVGRSSPRLAAFAEPEREEPALPLADAPALLVEGSELNRFLSFRLARGERAWSGAPPAGLSALLEERAPRWSEAWESLLALLNELREEARRQEARLLVASAPTRWDVLAPAAARAELGARWPELAGSELDLDRLERELSRAAPRADLPRASLVDAFRARAAEGERLHHERSGGWTPAAHALAARELARFVLEADA